MHCGQAGRWRGSRRRSSSCITVRQPVRAPRLTTENRLARFNFCRDVLSIRRKRHVKPLDLTRVVFTDEKFFRWNYQGPAQNSPICVVGADGRLARKTDLDPDVCTNEHSQRNPGTLVGATMVNGIVFPPCFIEEGVRIKAECCIRMLDDVYLPIVRTLSDLDPEATEQACTTGFIHRCLVCVRAKGRHFEHCL